MSLTAAQVFRDSVTAGVPSSGEHEPEKAEIRSWGRMIEGTANSSTIVKATLAALQAVTPDAETNGGIVLNDATASNNGFYYRSGGAWVKGRGFPDSVAVLTNIGGTANAITAGTEAGVNPADVQMIILPDPPGTNTSQTVTIALNGGAAEDIKAASGASLAIGDIIEGVGTLFFRFDTEWRQLFSSATGATFDHQGTWAAPTTYTEGQVVTGSDGNWYQLKVASATGDDPLGSVTGNWLQILAGAVVADNSLGEVKLTRGLSARVGALFDTVAELLADTVLTYSNVSAGDIIEAQGFRYEVADSAAVDAHETTAGGVKLYEAGPTFTARTRLGRADLSFTQVYLAEGQRSGWFEPVLISSLSAREQGRVTYDEANGQGVYVTSTLDASYVWRRVEYRTLGYVLVEWWGAERYVFGGLQDSTVAFETASTFCGTGGKWRWSGLHRITSQVLCRANQSVGSFGQTKEVDALICADPTAFTGVNTAATQSITNAVFADVPDASAGFLADGPVEFHDFMMYGAGYTLAASDGSKSIRLPSSDITDWRDQKGISYSKYITTRNVTLAMFRHPLVSEEGPTGAEGNFYSKHINTDLVSCYSGFRVRTTDSYNTECNDCRLVVAVFFHNDTDIGTRNFKFFGGSYESFSQPAILRGSTDDISFFGTYIETTVANGPIATNHYLFENGGSGKVSIAFEHCLVYLNHYRGLWFAQGSPAGPHIIKSIGNRFRLFNDAGDTADAHIIWNMSTTTTRGGALFADVLIEDAGNTKTFSYVTGATTSYVPFNAIIEA